jgi:cytoskeletal protein CcmA (bactofilin family)
VIERGVVVVRRDTVLRGKISGCQRIEIEGYVEGEIEAAHLVVLNGGTVLGRIDAETAEIAGNLQGDVTVRQLMTVAGTGSVIGKVRYGQLAMEAGARLRADVRNIPPVLGGDLAIQVERGRSVAITLEDLTATDPDDAADSLRYTASQIVGGSILLSTAGSRPVAANAFTQADLAAGRVAFGHDGSGGGAASFAVLVTDAAGATSGEARTVTVTVVD